MAHIVRSVSLDPPRQWAPGILAPRPTKRGAMGAVAGMVLQVQWLTCITLYRVASEANVRTVAFVQQ